MLRTFQAACLLTFLATIPGLARADLKINEFSTRSHEFVEILNAGSQSVDLGAWQIAAGIPPILRHGLLLFGTLSPGEFAAFSPCCPYLNDFPDDGGTIRLVHTQTGQVADAVSYGIFGAAPFGKGSTFRFPDGADTNDDARDFEFLPASHFVHTRSAPNPETTPELGSGILLNEIKWYSQFSPDSSAIELFNPTGEDVDLHGYWISDGDGMCQVAAHLVVPAGGYRVLRQGVPGEGLDCASISQITFDDRDVLYLFRAPLGGELYPVRVDQVGIWAGPSAWDPTRSFQRCADGEGPNDGFDFSSSGGSATYFFGPPTLGGTNNLICTVQAESSTWGRVKALYR